MFISLKKSIRKIFYSGSPEICMDVSVWAVGRKLPVISINPPVVDEVAPHITNDIYAIEEYNKHMSVLQRSQSLISIDNAYIRDSVGFIELPDGKIIYEGNWWINYLLEHPSYKRSIYFKNRFLKGNWYTLHSLWSCEYYHWFHDVLPRLETTLKYLPEDTKFLINERPREYQLESLKAYGIGVDRLEIQAQGFKTCVERMWFSTPVGHTSLGSGQVIAKVANRLVSYFKKNLNETNLKKIYISRKKAGMRRVVNEDELASVIKHKGYEVIVLEDLSWLQQLNLFYRSEDLMGPHGAGLVNMMFIGHKNSHITEITAQSNTVPCYLVLARQLGHSFRRIHALPLGERAGDMYLPPESLDQI